MRLTGGRRTGSGAGGHGRNFALGGCSPHGEIAESFDRRFLELLLHHRDEEILGWSNAHIEEEAGNGALEIKSWMALAGALPQGRRELICYEPVEAWGTGIALIDFGAVIK